VTEANCAAELTATAQGLFAAPLLEPATIGALAGSGETWITVGDPLDPVEERTVTVVFRRDPLDDFETGEYLLRPLAPAFPGRR
jgi:hypothetical protein